MKDTLETFIDFTCPEAPSEQAIADFIRLCEESDRTIGEARSMAFFTAPSKQLDGVTTTQR